MVSFNGNVLQAGKGGELTHDETTIISGALDLTEKVWTLKRSYRCHASPDLRFIN